MRQLILLRHAHAESATAGQDDIARPLSATGLAEARAAGDWLREHGLRPDRVLCSTAARTRETLAALGDIGTHFPDTDVQFRGADSAVLLAEAARRVRAAGWQIGNLDSTIVAQAPKLMPHIPAMRQRIAEVLGLQPDQINIKAKTAEKMGPVGQGDAMEARAIALIFC